LYVFSFDARSGMLGARILLKHIQERRSGAKEADIGENLSL
jgi:hypothetical protein